MMKIMEQVEASRRAERSEKVSFTILKSDVLFLRYEQLKIQFNFPRRFEFFLCMLGCLERELRAPTVEPWSFNRLYLEHQTSDCKMIKDFSILYGSVYPIILEHLYDAIRQVASIYKPRSGKLNTLSRLIPLSLLSRH